MNLLHITDKEIENINKMLDSKCSIFFGEETWRKFFQDIIYQFINDGKKMSVEHLYDNKEWHNEIIKAIYTYIDKDVVESFDRYKNPYQINSDTLNDISDKISYVLIFSKQNEKTSKAS